MRNYDDTPLPQRFPQRFRLPEKDTRRFYEKPEWWMAAVKWGIIAALLLGAVGFGVSFGMSKWKARKQRLEAAAQEERLREHEEAKKREAKEAREKAEKEAREKERAEARAEKERIRREKQEAEEQRRAEREQRRKELESREKGPRRVYDLEKQQQTAGVRWWGKSEPPKFASRKEGDEYWCVFTDGRNDTMVRVKVGADKNTPAAIDLADGSGYMRPFERELLDEAVAQKPHLVIMDRAAWVRLPQPVIERAAHVTIPQSNTIYPGETLLGESLFRLVKSAFDTNNRLDRLEFNLEFHWRGESRPPIAWKLRFNETLGRSKLNNAIESTLQAEMDASYAATAKTKKSAKPEKQHPTLASNNSSFAGGPRASRRLGENYRSFDGKSSTQKAESRAEKQQDQSPSRERQRVTRADLQRATDEGYLSVSFAE